MSRAEYDKLRRKIERNYKRDLDALERVFSAFEMIRKRESTKLVKAVKAWQHRQDLKKQDEEPPKP